MPDNVTTAAEHAGNAMHGVRSTGDGGVVGRILGAGGNVVSHHQQAVSDAGRLRVAARAEDGVIEAIENPARRFYIGVQWHPERTPDAATGAAIFRELVEAAREAM
jgi:putative glutamine amidotransferase